MTNPTPLTIGTRIRDNDPRMDTEGTIKSYARKDPDGWTKDVAPDRATHVVVAIGSFSTRIRMDRIHTDGKSRRTGWSVVR